VSVYVPYLLAVLAVWLLVCIYTGFRLRFMLFVCVLLIGLGLNALWMMTALEARPLERSALVAQASLLVYGLCAFGVGFLARRIRRTWKQGEVDSPED
jgi:4-amino-4-deoxy-L-arabinose transferase-like glycosyltransferase